MKEASHKVPDGKMVNINLETDSGKVKSVSIRGDFFLEPAEKLEELEDKIEGLDKDTEAQKIEEKLESVDAELIGFSRKDIGKAFRKAVGEEE
ncbi:MAG: lipoate protein ligase C-terminal domain-containing protein [Candidatus Nanohaloarchaea archaeon]